MKCISLAKVFHFPRPTKKSFLKDVKGFRKSYLSCGVDGACTIQILYNINIVSIFVKRFEAMRFVQILEDKRLWAVEYEGEGGNCFDLLFSNWYDMNWLKGFFKENLADLSSYFHITDVYEAVMETIDEAKRLECLMLDISPDANLDVLFNHLENTRFSEMALGREKTKGDGSYRHPSWLRIYAIKIEPGVYLVTGGAIKLTATMAERSHTLTELGRMEQVRNYLLDNGVFDLDGFNDYFENEQGN